MADRERIDLRRPNASSVDELRVPQRSLEFFIYVINHTDTSNQAREVLAAAGEASGEAPKAVVDAIKAARAQSQTGSGVAREEPEIMRPDAAGQTATNDREPPSLADKLRQDLTAISASPVTFSTSVTEQLKQIALSPEESRSELKTLCQWVVSEKEALQTMDRDVDWDTLSASNIDTLFANYRRLIPFKKAWDGLEARVRKYHFVPASNDLNSTEAELNAVVERKKAEFISELSSWGRNLSSRVAHLSQLETEILALEPKPNVDLYSYLEVFSSYINHFGFEPFAVWNSYGINFPTSVNPLRFTVHDSFEKRDVFPNAIYFPTTKTLTLEEFNDRFAAGIYPVGIVRGGKTLTADGFEFLSTHIVAAHDLDHLPLRADQRGSMLLDANQIELNRRYRQHFKSQIEILSEGEREGFSLRMESLYFFFFREQAMIRSDFLESAPISDRLISELVSENKEGNLDLLLGDKKFSSQEEIVSYIEKMREILVSYAGS